MIFEVKDKISDNITVTHSFRTYVKLIYPTGKSILLEIPDLQNFPKEGNIFNRIYKYRKIIIREKNTDNIIADIYLGYALKQIPYYNRE